MQIFLVFSPLFSVGSDIGGCPLGAGAVLTLRENDSSPRSVRHTRVIHRNASEDVGPPGTGLCAAGCFFLPLPPVVKPRHMPRAPRFCCLAFLCLPPVVSPRHMPRAPLFCCLRVTCPPRAWLKKKGRFSCINQNIFVTLQPIYFQLKK